ncbi:MAG: metallophosphoesterase [Cyanobacteria bacterium P01_G01_bin.39]
MKLIPGNGDRFKFFSFGQIKRRFIWLLIVSWLISLAFGCVGLPSKLYNNIKLTKSIYPPPRRDFRIVVISDLNSQYGSTEYEPEVKQAIAKMSQWQPDLVLCGGDMIAGQKASLTKLQIKAMWQAFENHIAAPLRSSKIPFGFTIGNHDGSGAIKNKSLVFKQERELATAYWTQHQDHLGLNFLDRANFPFYYSFQQNELFFLVWDASTANIEGEQLAWVKRTLNSSPAQQAQAIIVIGHLPLYPVAQTKNKPGEYLTKGNQLRSLLTQNQVLLYISGHHHAYYPGKIQSLKLLHAGALGQGERQLINSDLLPTKTVTLIDLELATSLITYTTYDAKTWKAIALEQLPASIKSDTVEIRRHDL